MAWSIPIAVIMVVPLGIIGALLAATFRELPNDVYFKVGLLTTVGLSTKNAILIIEFALDLIHHVAGNDAARGRGPAIGPAVAPPSSGVMSKAELRHFRCKTFTFRRAARAFGKQPLSPRLLPKSRRCARQ